MIYPHDLKVTKKKKIKRLNMLYVCINELNIVLILHYNTIKYLKVNCTHKYLSFYSSCSSTVVLRVIPCYLKRTITIKLFSNYKIL